MGNGFDGHFTQTMALVGDFLRHAKPDDKKLRQIVDEAKVTEKSLFNSSENVADMLLEKVKFREQSRYLSKLSFAEMWYIVYGGGRSADQAAFTLGGGKYSIELSLYP